MSADFPGSLYDPRAVINKPGFPYDAADLTVLFAEDLEKQKDEIVAIEGVLGLQGTPFAMPAGTDIWALFKRFLSWRRARIVLAIGSGTITPAGMGLAFLDPLGLGRTPTILAVGGLFTVTAPPAPIASYQIFVTASMVTPTAFNMTFLYRNYATGAFANTIAIPFGAVIGGDPSFTYELIWP
jgi:hypothetical protein